VQREYALSLHNCQIAITQLFGNPYELTSYSSASILYDRPMVICGSAMRVNGLDLLSVSGNCGDTFQRQLEYQAAGIGNCSSNSEQQTIDGLFVSLRPNFESGRPRQLEYRTAGTASPSLKSENKQKNRRTVLSTDRNNWDWQSLFEQRKPKT
jgi:hypothetical protein